MKGYLCRLMAGLKHTQEVKFLKQRTVTLHCTNSIILCMHIKPIVSYKVG